MTLKTTNGKSLTLDSVHLKSLTITQQTLTNAKKRLDLVCKRYGSLDGKKVFDNNEISFTNIDFDGYIIKDLLKSGKTPEEIPTYLKEIKDEVKTFDLAKVMIAVEHGIGLLLKDLDLFDYNTLE